MSHLEYSSTPWNKQLEEKHHFSGAVRLPDGRIECSGQGGWHPETGVIYRQINQQIAQAFENVDLSIRTAGGQGWEQVYRVNSYHVPLNDEAMEAMLKGFKRWMPNHKPIWTVIGVSRLGEDDMRVEIEVVAHDPKQL